MIGRRRPKVIPPTLRADGKGGLAADAHVKSYQPGVTPEDFDGHWQEADVHGALFAMQGWVCAYCGREIDPRDPTFVDHFRPKKGGYWWLAYVFGNLFVACSLCNGRKLERFPTAEGESCVTYETRAQVADECRLLLDPAEDPLDGWLRVDLSKAARGRISVPLPAHCAAETVRFFMLNDDPDHLQDRIRVITELVGMHKRGELDDLRKRASRYRPHSLTARAFLAAVAPHLLPDAREDLTWFVESLCERLLPLVECRQSSASVARRARVIKWTLAYLWKDPPVGTPEDVERCLERLRCKKIVQRYLTKLDDLPAAPAP
jgi:uncharacterized protein (TIGR02646 family)